MEAGYIDRQIKDKLNISYQWQAITTPYPHVRKFLATLWKDHPVFANRFDRVANENDLVKNPPPKEIETLTRNGFKNPDSF